MACGGEQFLFNLRDGFWERTAVWRVGDGSEVVRKELRRLGRDGPWAQSALHEEILYLRSLPEPARRWFPPLLESWDDGKGLGYSVPYLRGARDAAGLVLEGSLSDAEAEALQDCVVQAVFGDLHSESCRGDEPFLKHWRVIMEQSIAALGQVEDVVLLVEAPRLKVDGANCLGLRRAWTAVLDKGLPEAFDSEPCVRLHGDLILENVLWDRSAAPEPRMWLIDPVSVAGLWRGPPLFDLAKYESYARGGLYALRAGLFEAGPEPGSSTDWRFSVQWEAEPMRAFRRIDLWQRVRAAYVQHWGEPPAPLMSLLDAYFSLVMARNTEGRQQLARVLQAVRRLNEALGEGDVF
ncbi:MAG TPA: hypothetical protein VMN36_10215 [Verrucomicrobiales bacterium]|nr:hypothetical protein [Verrucomicrobiales bacterium]